MLDRQYVEAVRIALPELPDAKRARFIEQYGLRSSDAELLASDVEVSDYYEAVVAAAKPKGVDAATVCNWVVGELFRLLSYQEQIGTTAILSRAAAGSARGAVIVSLPGSRAAVELALTRILVPELPHLLREIGR